MEPKLAVGTLIATVLADIRQKGYSSVHPFVIGKVEKRMTMFAQANAVILASDDLYTATRIKDPAEFTLPKYRKI